MIIRNIEFKHKKDALVYFKNIVNSYEPIQTINENDFKDLVELIENHPDKEEKIVCGIKKNQVIEVRYKTKCFELIRKDGSTEVFSYRKRINSESNPLAKFRKTCSETISEDLRNVTMNKENR
ncbi:MAG: DCL family protein [Bacteroidales bacterium]